MRRTNKLVLGFVPIIVIAVVLILIATVFSYPKIKNLLPVASVVPSTLPTPTISPSSVPTASPTPTSTPRPNPAQTGNIISWTSSYKLNWDDFRGTPILNQNEAAVSIIGVSLTNGTDHSCSNNGGFSCTVNISNVVSVAKFNRLESWVDPSAKDQYGLLSHEQLHFDITQVYANKLRARLAGLTQTATASDPQQAYMNAYQQLNSQIDEIYNSIDSELNAIQNQYDSETNHGTNDSAQATWQQKISAQL